LWLKGDTMMKGYINADTGLDAYGYWNSEDIFERKHNKLFYKSRQKDLIKVNSYNVSPVNIENAILQYPNILEVCVTYRSRDMGEKEIVALVCTELSINTSELISFVKEKLFAYEIPKEIIIIEEPLVRNRMGKIQREANREKFVI
jgi:acyl-coenzyme A synthetase/AMP-(fatty) acid ligase